LHYLGYGLVLYSAGHAALATVLFRDAHDVAFAAFLVLGVASVGVYWTPSLLVMGAVSAVSVGATAWVGRPGEAAGMVVYMATACLLGVALLMGRRETLLRVQQLSEAEQERASELQVALGKLEVEVLERQRTEAQLQEAHRLDALGTLAGGVAHDMNNVLTAVMTTAQVAAEDLPEGSPAREDFKVILEAAKRGASLTTNLLGFARRGKRRNVAFSLEPVVQEVLALLGRTAPKSVRLHAELTAGTVVRGDPKQIGEAVMNLCLHALRSMPGEGTIHLRTGEGVLAKGESALLPAGTPVVTLEVTDDGRGMEPDAVAHAFEPFYETRAAAAARSDLGLAMVYGAMRDHHGEVLLRSAPGKGTTALLRFPRDCEAPPSTPPRGEAAAAGQRRGQVLVIDDEPLVRSAIRRLLNADKLACVEAGSGADGLALFGERPREFSLVVLDLSMPGMGGARCFELLREIDPLVPVLIASGYPKDQSVEAMLANGAVGFLNKPADRQEFSAEVSRLARPGPDDADAEGNAPGAPPG
jgi:signal transduction histidine kinase/ActR/RegA family two-component response regulator